MAAVTRAPPCAAGGFFGFLKDGVVVPMRNRGLFLPLVVLHAARSMAFHLARTLAFRFFATTVNLEAYDDGGVDRTLLFALAGKFVAGRWHLLYAGLAYLAAHVALGLAIDAAAVSAAVASCRGEEGHTTLLAKVRDPMVTVMFGKTVLWTLAGVSVVPATAFIPGMAILVLLFQLMVLLFIFLYDVVCSVAVVVSAAEPGLRGAAAVGRARRLMRGGRKLAQALLYALAALALRKAIWKMHAATMVLLPQSTAPFPLDGVIVYLLLGAFKVLCTSTITAYYFDCRRTEEGNKAGHAE